ncbi:MAG TPA: biotin carboxylase N-terminal domain-containing protein [Solirubrobacteraceae bacterium]|nr:biotin carboxylase N-terminal domain-containing protein [Solirubrobacteraceae bacterium]
MLIANRGEIAVRIARACHAEGLEAVLAVSDADRGSLGAQLADRAICIGPAPATESYLDIDRLLAAATVTGCDALHPGYGFVSERPELPEACAEAGVTFVGPSAAAMRRSGDKATARAAARALGIPIGDGSDLLASAREAREVADQLGYPVLLKAAAGGGGRGMRRVQGPGEMPAVFTAAAAEAQQAFGDGRLFMERFVTSARHVEVQVLADGQGKVIHLGHRDCTLQRRYQKLVEEAPADGLAPGIGDDVLDAATRLIGSMDYQGAATCEFLVDAERATSAFLEINARLQVEHPVSEMVTGVDVVREQLRIAGGAPLSVTQADVAPAGHAIEARINAESPSRGFMPAPGTLERWVQPSGPGVRVDTACFPGWTITPYYDSLLAKVIVHARDRLEALERLRGALGDLHVAGVPTTAGFVMDVLAHPDVRSGRVHTRWLEETFVPSWSPRVAA